MLGYLTLGSEDIERSGDFYDAVLGVMGISRVATKDNEIGYAAAADGTFTIWVVKPFDEKPASVGNGSMLAFRAASRAEVDEFYRQALAHGGRDEGKPGLRPYGDDFYACYVRDPDGNKLSAVSRHPS